MSTAITRDRQQDRPAGQSGPAGQSDPAGRIDVAVQALAERCRYEEGHTRQVTRLALRLFDELAEPADLHGLAGPQRRWLQWAAMLHDIGLGLTGAQGHHKTALRCILDDRSIPWDDRLRRIVACVARYHRKALPSPRHEAFAELAEPDRQAVRKLAAILRVADGLDRTHRDVVADVRCRVSPKRVEIRCTVRGPAEDAEEELHFAHLKADLFSRAFGRSVRLEAIPADDDTG